MTSRASAFTMRLRSAAIVPSAAASRRSRETFSMTAGNRPAAASHNTEPRKAMASLRPSCWEMEAAALRRAAASCRVANRVNHYCVEGWTAVETWTGVRMSDLAKLVQPDSRAKFVDFQSFDDGYHESWDIESALHHQTVVAYALDGTMLGPAHGAPARVYSPVKLGYKNTKYLTKIAFMPVANGGYWSDEGYEWYGGV